eukprot:619399-Rhodomonas_salina.1
MGGREGGREGERAGERAGERGRGGEGEMERDRGATPVLASQLSRIIRERERGREERERGREERGAAPVLGSRSSQTSSSMSSSSMSTSARTAARARPKLVSLSRGHSNSTFEGGTGTGLSHGKLCFSQSAAALSRNWHVPTKEERETCYFGNVVGKHVCDSGHYGPSLVPEPSCSATKLSFRACGDI